MLGGQPQRAGGTNFCLVESRKGIPDCFKRCLAVPQPTSCSSKQVLGNLRSTSPTIGGMIPNSSSREWFFPIPLAPMMATFWLRSRLGSRVEDDHAQSGVLAWNKSDQESGHFKFKGWLWFLTLQLNGSILSSFFCWDMYIPCKPHAPYYGLQNLSNQQSLFLLTLISCFQLVDFFIS